MRHPPPARDPEAAFAELYTTVYPDLVGFVRRRGHDHDAEDVAAEALTDADSRAATDSCRDSQLDSADGAHTGQLDSARCVLTERRGVWLTVALAGPDGFSALCITDDSTRFFTEDTVGSVGTADVPTPGPTDVVATDLGTTTTMDAGHLSLAVGVVGDQVAGVTYRSLEHGEVTATVTDGHFAFWVPGAELRDLTAVPVEVLHLDGSTSATFLTLR